MIPYLLNAHVIIIKYTMGILYVLHYNVIISGKLIKNDSDIWKYNKHILKLIDNYFTLLKAQRKNNLRDTEYNAM